ncbi:MAG TPA: hypothetical protein VGD01_11900 [Candidatus Elarobacter sp.]|jgi:hypothetical protein
MASRSTIKAAAKLRSEEDGVKAQDAAVKEAARVREMFAEDRRRLDRRYGVVSTRGMSSETGGS